MGCYSYACFEGSHSTTHTEAGQKQNTFMHVHAFYHAVVDLSPHFSTFFMIDCVSECYHIEQWPYPSPYIIRQLIHRKIYEPSLSYLFLFCFLYLSLSLSTSPLAHISLFPLPLFLSNHSYYSFNYLITFV